MDFVQILTLAIVQGLTEFLPISSSAHLILSPYLFGFDDQGLAFDVAVHLGTLIAVIVYFRPKSLPSYPPGFVPCPPSGDQSAESRLGWAVIIGTIPVVLAGLLLKSLIEGELRAPWVIATTTIIFGLLLWWADIRSRRDKPLQNLGIRDALIIGCAQAAALIPGTSRSGITMTAALMLGYTREAAAHFSFLLAIPTILASSLMVTKDLLETNATVDWASLGLGVLLSGVAAYLVIRLFLQFIERIGMWPFVVYRLLLGVTILMLI